MEEIQLQDIFHMLLKRAWVIVLITVLAVATSGIVSFFVLEPQYQTYTTLMLGKPQDVGTAIEHKDVVLNRSLVGTYQEIARSNIVLKEVIENLEKDMTIGKLRGKINVSLVRDTEIIKITVTDTSPERAALLTNETAQVFMKNVVSIMQMENVQVIDVAQVRHNPVKPNKTLNIAIAGILGMMVSLFIIFLLEYLDNTIKTPEDIEKHLGLPVMGMIPEVQN